MSEDNNAVVTLKVRVTPEFREKIIDAAKENSRSMNAEIVHRLEQSFLSPKKIYDNYVDINKALDIILNEIKDIKKAP